MQCALQLRGAACNLTALVNIPAQIPGRSTHSYVLLAVSSRGEGCLGCRREIRTLSAFAGGFCTLLPLDFHGSVFQLGKAKDRHSELPQNMSRSLWEAENVQISGKSWCVHCQRKPNHDQFAFTQPRAQGVVQVLGSW